MSAVINADGSTITEYHIYICRNKHFPYIASYHGPWLSLPIELIQTMLNLNNKPNNQKPPPVDPNLFLNLVAIRKLVDDAGDFVIKAANGNVGSMFGNQGKISFARQHRFRELAIGKLAKAYAIDEIATSVLTMQSASSLDDVAAKVLKKNPENIDAQFVHFFHEKIPSRLLAASTDTTILDKVIQLNLNQPICASFLRTRALVHCFREEFKNALADFKHALTIIKTEEKKKKKPTRLAAEDCDQVLTSSTSISSLAITKLNLNNVNGRKQFLESSANKKNMEDIVNEAGCTQVQIYFLRAACYHQYAISLIDKAVCTVNDLIAAEADLEAKAANGVAKKKKKKKKKKVSTTTGNEEEEVEECEEEVALLTSVSRKKPTSAIKSPLKQLPPQPATLRGVNPFKQEQTTNQHPNQIPTITPKSSASQILKYKTELSKYSAQIVLLTKRSTRDYTKFLSFFPSTIPLPDFEDAVKDDSGSSLLDFINSLPPMPETFAKEVMFSDDYGRECMIPNEIPRNQLLDRLEESENYENFKKSQMSNPMELTLGTYHPLLVEAWHGLALNLLILGDFETAGEWHKELDRRTKHVEGYPVFLPARSMSQADYVETLKTLIKFLGDKKKRKKILKENSVVKSGDGSGHTVRQYPLHTKRVDMLMVWIQSFYYKKENEDNEEGKEIVPVKDNNEGIP